MEPGLGSSLWYRCFANTHTTACAKWPQNIRRAKADCGVVEQIQIRFQQIRNPVWLCPRSPEELRVYAGTEGNEGSKIWQFLSAFLPSQQGWVASVITSHLWGSEAGLSWCRTSGKKGRFTPIFPYSKNVLVTGGVLSPKSHWHTGQCKCLSLNWNMGWGSGGLYTMKNWFSV